LRYRNAGKPQIFVVISQREVVVKQHFMLHRNNSRF
jgi:hypothetical protein